MKATPYNIDLLLERTHPSEAPDLALWALKHTKAFTFLPLCNQEFYERHQERIEEVFVKNVLSGVYDEFLPSLLEMMEKVDFMNEQSHLAITRFALEKDAKSFLPHIAQKDLNSLMTNLVEGDCHIEDQFLFSQVANNLNGFQAKSVSNAIELPFCLAAEYQQADNVALVAQHFPQLVQSRADTISKMLSDYKEQIVSLGKVVGVNVDINNLTKEQFPKMHQTLLFGISDIQMTVIGSLLPYFTQEQMQKLEDHCSYLPGFPKELTAKLQKTMLNETLADILPPVSPRKRI